MIDEKLKQAILKQVRLSSATLSVAMALDRGADLDHALTVASKSHRVDRTDLTIAWTEIVLRNGQSIISRPWMDRKPPKRAEERHHASSSMRNCSHGMSNSLNCRECRAEGLV